MNYEEELKKELKESGKHFKSIPKAKLEGYQKAKEEDLKIIDFKDLILDTEVIDLKIYQDSTDEDLEEASDRVRSLQKKLKELKKKLENEK